MAISLPAPIHRIAQFLKSLWPADRGFVALLLGSILLLMARNMGSWSSWVQALLRAPSADSRFVAIEASSLLNLTMFAIYFAGAAALFVCFFPGQNPSKRFARWVYLPVGAGLAANIATVLYLARSYPAVPFPDGETLSLTLHSLARLLHAFGSGIWSALLGTFLVLYGDLRLRSGYARLPVHFTSAFSARPNGSTDRQVNRFVWLMIALPFLASFLDLPAYYLPYWIHDAIGHGEVGWKPSWSLRYVNGETWEAVALFALVYVAMGSSRRDTLRRSLRIPSGMYLGLAVLFPAIVFAAPPLLHYSFDRIHWAAHDFHHFEPPIFLSYLSLPPWPYLFLIPAALVEEIAWRGYLQPRLISRYGLYRGVFLLGIVWGIFHFPSDFNSRMTLTQILIHPVTRLLNCVSLGFALSWLTLRSRSVLPAALLHGFMNVLIISKSIATSVWVLILLWTVIDTVLFRYCPPDAYVGSGPALMPDDPPQHLQQLPDTLS